MYGARKERSTWVIIGRLLQGKGAVSIPKALFFSYSANIFLIQLDLLGTLRACPKLEVSTWMVVYKTS